MNQDMIYRNRHRIIRGFWIVMALIVVWAVADYVSHIGKVPVVVSTVPGDASVSLDGNRIGGGTQWIIPGTYKVTVKKDGFAEQARKIIISPEKAQNVLALALKPQSDDAKKWAKEHADDYKKNEEFGAIEARNNGDFFSKRNPITTKLPYTDPYFKIGYVTDPNDLSIKLTIETPSPRYRFYAVEKIRSMGYDPTDFEIMFKDFHNPLEKKS